MLPFATACLVAGLVMMGAAVSEQDLSKLSDNDPLKKELADESLVLKAWSAPGASGLLITGVAPGGQAEAAGLRPGDIIYAFGDKMAPTGEDIASVAKGTPKEQEVALSYLRGRDPMEVKVHGGPLGVNGVPVVQGPGNVEAKPTAWEPDWTLLDKGGEEWYITEAGGRPVGWGHHTWKKVGNGYVGTTEGRSEGSRSTTSGKLARVKGLLLSEYVAKQDGKVTCHVVRDGEQYTVTIGGKTVVRSYPYGALPYDMAGFLERSLPVKPGLVFNSYQINERTGALLGRLQYIMRPARSIDLAGKKVTVTPLEWVRLGQLLWTTYFDSSGRMVSSGFADYGNRTATKSEVLKAFADKPWKP